MRPRPPAWGVEVNETALLMTQTMPAWWLEWCHRNESRITTLVAGVGSKILISCDDRADAEAMVVSLTMSVGMPRTAVKLRRDDRRPATKGTSS